MRDDSALSVFNIVYSIFAIPCNFAIGFIIGVAAPVAAIGAMVAGVRLLTGKVPFLTSVEDKEGERHLSLALVSQEEVGSLFEAQKEQIGGDIGRMKAEIQAIIEEARAEAQEAAQAANEESLEEA